MIVHLLMAGMLAGTLSPLESARDAQDRTALARFVNEAAAAAANAPKDAAAQFRLALASSYLAEVEIETHDKKAAQQAAVRGVQAAERAIALNPNDAENYRILATLCGQAINDIMSGLSYGPRAKDAVNTAVSLAPKSSAVWVARGVGNYYMPAQFGGGAAQAVADFRKAIELDSNNAEAWLWLGIALRKQNNDAEARQAFGKALALNPNRVWVRHQLAKTPAK
ncbi:MAG: tetratricopeptide repeat protein [Bryobacteraceae bacterium]